MTTEKKRFDIRLDEVTNGIRYRTVRSREDVELIVGQYVRTFIADEALFNTIGDAFEIETSTPQTKRFEEIVDEGVSVIATQVDGDEERLVGSLSAYTLHRFDDLDDAFHLNDALIPAEMLAIRRFVHETQAPAVKRIFDEDATADRILVLFMTCVEREFRGKGFADELGTRALRVGRLAGCDWALTVCTHPHSEAVTRSGGFREYNRATMGDTQVVVFAKSIKFAE